MDTRIGLLDGLAECFTGYRSPNSTEHSMETPPAQRIHGWVLIANLA